VVWAGIIELFDDIIPAISARADGIPIGTSPDSNPAGLVVAAAAYVLTVVVWKSSETALKDPQRRFQTLPAYPDPSYHRKRAANLAISGEQK
jgi:hypothetical protein